MTKIRLVTLLVSLIVSVCPFRSNAAPVTVIAEYFGYSEKATWDTDIGTDGKFSSIYYDEHYLRIVSPSHLYNSIVPVYSTSEASSTFEFAQIGDTLLADIPSQFVNYPEAITKRLGIASFKRILRVDFCSLSADLLKNIENQVVPESGEWPFEFYTCILGVLSRPMEFSVGDLENAPTQPNSRLYSVRILNEDDANRGIEIVFTNEILKKRNVSKIDFFDPSNFGKRVCVFVPRSRAEEAETMRMLSVSISEVFLITPLVKKATRS